MTEPIRLCCDCRFYKKDWNARITGFGDTFDLCLHPALTGKVKDRFCDILRMEWGKCGPYGKYWEARK